MKSFVWVKWVVIGVIILITCGLLVRSWISSQVVGHLKYRFNFAMIVPDTGITFVSFDPSGRSILALEFPTNLAIHSRTKGEYAISSLYKLGSYQGEGGMFARQKIQGFMRVPIPGYMVVDSQKENVKSRLKIGLLKIIFGKSQTNLSRFDAAVLYYRTNRYAWRLINEDELIRAGVIENTTYHPERLQEYVGTRLFDWGIGATGLTVAIVNASGENGLGSDLADFLSNLGLDVVMVRSVTGNEISDTTSWQVNDQSSATELGYIFQNLFGFNLPKIERVPAEFRSSVLILVGKDAKELF
jgi:hypothetical protein